MRNIELSTSRRRLRALEEGSLQGTSEWFTAADQTWLAGLAEVSDGDLADRAKGLLVASITGLLVNHARSLAVRFPNWQDAHDELMAVGRISALEALRTFDPSAGSKVSSWMMFRAQRKMAATQPPNPLSLTAAEIRIKAIADRVLGTFAEQYGRTPTTDELVDAITDLRVADETDKAAEKLGLPADDARVVAHVEKRIAKDGGKRALASITDLLRATRTAYLDAEIGDGSLGDTLTARDQNVTEVDVHERLEAVMPEGSFGGGKRQREAMAEALVSPIVQYAAFDFDPSVVVHVG